MTSFFKGFSFTEMEKSEKDSNAQSTKILVRNNRGFLSLYSIFVNQALEHPYVQALHSGNRKATSWLLVFSHSNLCIH